MKVKRLVSLLLAVMLIVGMIPTNAFAALSYDDSKGETNRANITLLVSKNAPATVSDYATISSQITDKDTLAVAKTTLEANAKKANAAWDGDSTEDVAVGDIVYIGFKLTPEDVDSTINGIAATGFWVKYDPEVLSPVRLKDIYVDPYDEVAEETTAIEASEFDDEKQSYFNQTYYNDLAKGKDGAASGSLFSKVKGNYSLDGVNELFSKYCASAYLSTDEKATVDVQDGEYTGYILFGVTNKDDYYYPLATGSNWDVVIPMIVKSTEKTSMTFEVTADSEGQSTSSIALATKTFDNKTELTNNQVVILGDGGKLKSTDATINIVNKVEKPVDEESKPDDPEYDVDAEMEKLFTGSVENRKNNPFVAQNTNDSLLYDTITIPSSMSGINGSTDTSATGELVKFNMGDVIYVYGAKDEDGNRELLGFTQIDNNSVVTADGTTLGSTDSVVGKTIKLVKYDRTITTTEVDGASTQQATYTKSTDSDNSYIHEQDKVWIARLSADKAASVQDVAVDEDALIPVAIEPETTLYYNSNYELADREYGSAANPIKVYVGQSIEDAVKASGIDTTDTFAASVEGGKTVNTTADWAKATSATATAGTFTALGNTTVVANFKSAKTTRNSDRTGVAAYDVSYAQPTVYNGADVPSYGVALHVQVQANPSDFSVVYGTDGDKGTLAISGMTADALTNAAYADITLYDQEVSDQKKILNTNSNQYGFSAMSWEVSGLTNPEGLNEGETAVAVVAISVKNKAEGTQVALDPFNLAIMKTNVWYVEGDVNVTVSGSSTVNVEQTDDITAIFEELDPTFTIVQHESKDGTTTKNSATVHVMDLTDSNGKVFNPNDVTAVSDSTSSDENVVKTGTYKEVAKTAENGDTLAVSYVIPNGTVTVDVNSNVAVVDEAGSSTKPITYYNTAGSAVKFNALMVNRVKLTPVDGSSITTEITKNGRDMTRSTKLEDIENYDLFTIKGDNYVNDEHYDAELAVKTGDKVIVYEDEKGTTKLTEGVVYKVEDGESNTKNYCVKVEQLGATISKEQLEKMTYRIIPVSRETDVLRTELMHFSTQEDIPVEPYTLLSVEQPTEVTVEKKAEDFGNNLPDLDTLFGNTYTVTYGRYVNGLIPEDATKSLNCTLTGTPIWQMYDSEGHVVNVDSLDAYDGTKKINATVDLSSGLIKKDDTNKLDADIVVEGDLQAVHTLTHYLNITKRDYGEKDPEKPDAPDPDEPSVPVVTANVTVNNNRFPLADTVTVKNPSSTVDLTVRVYNEKPYITTTDSETGEKTTTKSDSENLKKLAEVKVAADGEETVELNDSLEQSTGGKLYITVSAAGTSESTAEAAVAYTYEDYTFWDLKIVDESGAQSNDSKTATVNLNRDQIETIGQAAADAETDENEKEQAKLDAELAFVKNNLPKTFRVTAVRFTKNAAGEVVVDDTQTQTLTTSLSTDWLLREGETYVDFTNDKVSTLLGAAGTVKTSSFKRTITSSTSETETSDLSKLSVVVRVEGTDGNQKVSTAKIKSDLPGNATRTSDVTNPYDAFVTLNVTTDQDDVKFDVTGYEKYVTVERVTYNDAQGKKKDDKVAVTFNFDDPAKNVMAGATVSFIALDESGASKKFEGTIDENGQLTIENVYVADNTSSILMTFTKKINEKDQTGTLNIDVPSPASETAVTSVVTPREIAMTAGSILDNSDIYAYVNGDGTDENEFLAAIETVTVNLEGDTTATVALKKADSAANASVRTNGNKVEWKLYTTTTGAEPSAADWDSYSTNFKTDLASRASDETEYYLVAQLDETSLATNSLKNEENVLAKVPVILYDGDSTNYALGDFPLQLTDGNSDLYWNEVNSDRVRSEDVGYAAAERQARSEEDGVTYSHTDFRTDVIFYYLAENYNDNVLEYVDKAQAIKSLTDVAVDNEAWATWVGTGSNADNVKIEQVQANGEAISKLGYTYADGSTVETIDPKYSEDSSKYLVPKESYTRGEEDYAIRYKVLNENTVYVTMRKARLTYKPADADRNHAVTMDDGTEIINIFKSKQKLFVPKDGDDTMASYLENKVQDINKDGAVTMDDGTEIINVYKNKTYIAQRW